MLSRKTSVAKTSDGIFGHKTERPTKKTKFATSKGSKLNEKTMRSSSEKSVRWSLKLHQMRLVRQSFFGLAARMFPLLAVATYCLAVATANQEISTAAVARPSSVGDGEPASNRQALEAELENLLAQHDSSGVQQDSNNKVLSEAIISRLMLGNLSEPNQLNELAAQTSDLESALNEQSVLSENEAKLAAAAANEQQQQQQQAYLFGPDAARLRPLLSYLHNYEIDQATGGLNNGQFPILPAIQAATIKRASAKVGNYLKQQANIRGHPNIYERNNFDFGLGKRFGDSSIGSSGQLISSGFGKRPTAHRFDFGLGKRIASPAYPRYDFGLGKRSPNRIRYDFGLGK